MQSLQEANLSEYITQCKTRLNKILARLEWSEENTLKVFNTNSIASSKKELKPSCPEVKATYPESCITKNSVVIETPKLKEILDTNEIKAPDNFQELQGNFSREQKLKIYEYVIANTQKFENSSLNQELEGEISLADILAQKKKEQKQKKRKFRKSKPTHTEEVRLLVDLQMQALEQFMGFQNGKETKSAKCNDRKKTDNNIKARKRKDDSNIRDREIQVFNRSKRYDDYKIKEIKKQASGQFTDYRIKKEHEERHRSSKFDYRKEENYMRESKHIVDYNSRESRLPNLERFAGKEVVNQHELKSQRSAFENDHKTEGHYVEQRKSYNGYYQKSSQRATHAEDYRQRKYRRSRSEDKDRHRRERYRRSTSNESSYKIKRKNRSRSKSFNREVRRENKRRRSKSSQKSREGRRKHSRSNSKITSRERISSRCHKDRSRSRHRKHSRERQKRENQIHGRD